MVALVWRTPFGTQATVTVQMDMREQTVNPLHAICHAQKWEGSAMQANVSASVDGLESTAISEWMAVMATTHLREPPGLCPGL